MVSESMWEWEKPLKLFGVGVGVGVGVPCVQTNLVWGITGISARTKNLPFVTSSKTVLGKGSDADEGKSLMLCPRISVLSLACPSVIGNELCLVQRVPLSECKHHLVTGMPSTETAPLPPRHSEGFS